MNPSEQLTIAALMNNRPHEVRVTIAIRGTFFRRPLEVESVFGELKDRFMHARIETVGDEGEVIIWKIEEAAKFIAWFRDQKEYEEIYEKLSYEGGTRHPTGLYFPILYKRNVNPLTDIAVPDFLAQDRDDEEEHQEDTLMGRILMKEGTYSRSAQDRGLHFLELLSKTGVCNDMLKDIPLDGKPFMIVWDHDSTQYFVINIPGGRREILPYVDESLRNQKPEQLGFQFRQELDRFVLEYWTSPRADLDDKHEFWHLTDAQMMKLLMR